jgi:protoporphyrin/coproporphyrin ferrochelatase
VLVTRPRQSAKLYQKVWTPKGSPLLVTTEAQARALEQEMSAAHREPIRVVVGMRYGRPSIAQAVADLTRANVDRILAFPMYPQYAGATTGSSLQQLFEDIKDLRVVPSIRVVPPYFDDPGYIGALATVTREALERLPQPPTHLLASFHGLPRRYADEGDPYPQQCLATARLLEAELGRDAAPLSVVFQSRFGREEWLQPYTDKRLEELGSTGARVAILCPGFTADCLETLEEIRLRGEEQFHSTGGRDYLAIPCLNEHPSWIAAMSKIARRELDGWL